MRKKTQGGHFDRKPLFYLCQASWMKKYSIDLKLKRAVNSL